MAVWKFRSVYVNSAYPDQTPQNAASDQGLHCLLTECPIKFEYKIKNTTQEPFKRKWTYPTDKSGTFHSALMG